MIDEDELQRNELMRLLSTAKDDVRRQLIQNAIDALDRNIGHERYASTLTSNSENDSIAEEINSKSSKINVHALNPATHASLFMNTMVNHSEYNYLTIHIILLFSLMTLNLFADAIRGNVQSTTAG